MLRERDFQIAQQIRVPYELSKFKRDPSGFAPAEFRSLHPLGRAPIIKDGDTTVVESGAIIKYVVARYGNGALRPKPGSAHEARYWQFLHFAEGSAMQHLICVFLLDTVAPQATQHPLRSLVSARIDQDFAFMNAALAMAPFFGGTELTGADINMTFVLRFARDFLKRDLGPYAHVAGYLARIEAREAFKKAMSIV